MEGISFTTNQGSELRPVYARLRQLNRGIAELLDAAMNVADNYGLRRKRYALESIRANLGWCPWKDLPDFYATTGAKMTRTSVRELNNAMGRVKMALNKSRSEMISLVAQLPKPPMRDVVCLFRLSDEGRGNYESSYESEGARH